MENEKINIRNMYIELLNKLKGVEGVDIHYIDQMVQLLEHDIDLIEIPVNWILSVIPSGTTTDDPLVKSSQVPAAQVNSDWNATSGVAEILNKPRLYEPIKDIRTVSHDGGWTLDTVSGYYIKDVLLSNVVNENKSAYIALIPTGSALTPTSSEASAYNSLVTFEYFNFSGDGIIRLYSRGIPSGSFTIMCDYYTG